MIVLALIIYGSLCLGFVMGMVAAGVLQHQEPSDGWGPAPLEQMPPAYPGPPAGRLPRSNPPGRE